MKEQSAVDFLHSKILFNIGLDDNDIFKLRELAKIAKKLEEKQHGKTWDAGLSKYEVRAGNYMRAYEDFDDWYTETYGSKGSDETNGINVEKVPNVISSQTEISEPNPQLIESMCYRYRHDFGLLEDNEKESIKTTMKQLWEEVVGKGFYKPKEISDEQIEKFIEENYKPNYIRIFVWEGIKWYREQLKTK